MNFQRAARPRVLRIQNLGFAYPGEPALMSGLSLDIEAGVTLLYGDTGSGKSTLLRAMAGALPAQGRLAIAGVGLDEDPGGYRRQLFFVDPATEAFDAMTVHECTDALRAGDAGFDELRWQSLVEGFALAPHLAKKMFMLSTGSKRKVWLASALASGRALTLLDEPTGGLDAASTRCLWRALADAARDSGRAIVIASAQRIDEVPLAGVIELPLR